MTPISRPTHRLRLRPAGAVPTRPTEPIPKLSDSDVALLGAVSRAVGPAIRHQMWQLYTDADGGLAPIALPCADLPIRALDSDIRLLCRMFDTVLAETALAAVVLVWERPGDGRLDPDTLVWVAGLADAAPAAGIPLRAQLVAFDGGVRFIDPEEAGRRKAS